LFGGMFAIPYRIVSEPHYASFWARHREHIFVFQPVGCFARACCIFVFVLPRCVRVRTNGVDADDVDFGFTSPSTLIPDLQSKLHLSHLPVLHPPRLLVQAPRLRLLVGSLLHFRSSWLLRGHFWRRFWCSRGSHGRMLCLVDVCLSWRVTMNKPAIFDA